MKSFFKNPAVAAFMSFLLPGLGQALAGKPRRGVIIAIPAVSLAAVLVFMLIVARKQLLDGLVVNSGLLMSLLIIDIITALYHVWAVVDAYLLAARPEGRTGSRIAGSRSLPSLRPAWQVTFPVLMAVLVCTVGVHLWFGSADLAAQNSISCVFNQGGMCGQDNNFARSTPPPDSTVDPADLASGSAAVPVGGQPTPYAAWVSNTDGVKVRNGPGTTYTQLALIAKGTAITGEIVSGGSYTINGKASTDWIKISDGTPLAGGFAAAAYFDATMITPTVAPNSTPYPIVFPVTTMQPVTGVSTDWAADGYLNVLLVGADAGQGRTDLRSDTMILLQVKIATGQAAMYGIPRNLFNVPLPAPWQNAWACHCFYGFYGSPASGGNYMLNALWLWAAKWAPEKFPLSGYTDWERGFKVLEGTVGEMTGVHVDGAVYINLLGFVKLIDDLGGLDMYVSKELKDDKMPFPDKPGTFVLDIPAGQQHMDGATALAYARSRHASDDTDRMARQQSVIKALRSDFSPCSVAPRIPSLLNDLGGLLWTDLPQNDALKLAGLAQAVGGNSVQSYSFIPQNGYPEYVTPASVAKMRNQVAHGLDTAPVATPTTGSGGGGGGFGFSC